MQTKSLFLTATTALALAIGCSQQPDTAVEQPAEANPGSSGVASQQPIRIELPPVQGSDRPPPAWVDTLNYTAEGPFPIDLRDVPTRVFDPDNKLDRGWGRSGPKRMRGPIPAEEADRLREEALGLPPNSNIQSLGVAGQAPSSATSFDSLDIVDCCGGGASVPPDPELAVGPDHIIAVVNVAFEVYNKAGALLAGPTTLSSFFSGTPGCSATAVFDPNVLYDESADRFIVGVDGGGTDYCVAATTGSNPLGTWNRYGFVANFGNAFFDYPHAGVGVEAIFMGSNNFLPGGFEGRVFAINKTQLYAGSTLTVVTRSTGEDDSTPQPANLHGVSNGSFPTTGPHYIMTEVFDGAIHSVWRWKDPFGNNGFVKLGDLDLVAFTGVPAGFPIDVPQSGGSDLQANDWRGLDNEYRNGFLWLTGMISCNPGGGTVDCIRWAKIDPTVPSIVDAGVFSSPGEYRSFPDLAVNDSGDMAIGYTKSSASSFPSIYVTGRESDDAAGTVQTEVLMKAGEKAYSAFDDPPHRWGDYTGMTIDPDGRTFWYLGEYSKITTSQSGDWGTYIGSFTYSDASIFADGFESGNTSAWAATVP